MKRVPIEQSPLLFPEEIRRFLEGARLFDSSCSKEARVIYADKGDGFYIKNAPKGSLSREAVLCEYFHSKGLAPAVISYLSLESDWLFTEAARGEDCTCLRYLDEPKRLCDKLALILRSLHETEPLLCPEMRRTDTYLATVREGYRTGRFDPSYIEPSMGIRTAQEAIRILDENQERLRCDTLIHGDYCLPNIILDEWDFSSFIDLGGGGVADRHIDLFWGAWTLRFNLKTDKYRERFFDAYGRDLFEPDMIGVISVMEAFG